MGLFGGRSKEEKINDKNLEFQQVENQKNREYNLMLAQTQNQWNVEQWERENEYNLPVNQMRRLNDAGLNKDLSYGSLGASGLTAASSPELTSGAPSPQMDYSGYYKPMNTVDRVAMLTQSANSFVENAYKAAMIGNVNADTNLKNSQATGQSITNKQLPEQLDIARSVQSATERLLKEQKNLTRNQAAQMVYQSQATANQAIYTHQLYLNANLEGQRLQEYKSRWSAFADAELSKVQSEADAARNYSSMLVAQKYQLATQAEVNRAQEALIKSSTKGKDIANFVDGLVSGRVEKEIGNYENADEYYKWLQWIGDGFGAVGSVLGGAGTAIINKKLGTK